MSHVEFAKRVIDKMQIQGRKCVVVVKRGASYSGRPIVFYEGTSQYQKLKVTKRVLVIGYYDPECLVRHLAGDVQEYFKGNA